MNGKVQWKELAAPFRPNVAKTTAHDLDDDDDHDDGDFNNDDDVD